MNNPLRRPTPLGIAVLGVLTIGACERDSSWGVLEEEWSIAFPSGTEIARVSLSDDSTVLAQTNRGLFLGRLGESNLKFLGAFDVLKVVGLESVTGGVEIVDARTSRVIRLESDEELTRWANLRARSAILHAVHTPCGWTTAGIFNGRSWVQVGQANGRHRTLENVLSGEIALASFGSRIVATEVEAPFRIVTWECDRSEFSGPFGGMEGQHASKTRSLGAFAMHGSIMRVLTDLGSDRRVIQLFDLDGVLLEERSIDAPLGLADANCHDQVIGVRSIDVTEAVVYRWRRASAKVRSGGTGCG